MNAVAFISIIYAFHDKVRVSFFGDGAFSLELLSLVAIVALPVLAIAAAGGGHGGDIRKLLEDFTLNLVCD